MDESMSPRDFRRMRGNGGRTPGRFSHGLSSYVLISCALQWYAGADLMFPMMMIAACELVLYFTVDASRTRLISTLSVQAGQIAWHAFSFSVWGVVAPLHAATLPSGIGLLGLGYLMARPGRLPLYMLGTYQLCELMPELSQLAQTPWDTALSKQLVVSTTLRLWAILVMGRLHQELLKAPSATVTST